MAHWGMYTEKQIEAWLELETRTLPMPDGASRRHRAMRLVWDVFESLVEDSGYSQTELVGYALEEAEIQGIDFEEAFRGTVSWLDDQRRRQRGVL